MTRRSVRPDRLLHPSSVFSALQTTYDSRGRPDACRRGMYRSERRADETIGESGRSGDTPESDSVVVIS
jgi:hypothetical protein